MVIANENLIVFLPEPEHVSFIHAKETNTVKFKKQILKRGVFKAPPPYKNIDIDFNDNFFNSVIDAFNAGAVENVPILFGTHDEKLPERVVGRVIELLNEEKGLYGIHEIADEEVVNKITSQLSDGKGLVDEVSVKINYNVPRDDGNTYPLALFHVAIVTHAWYQGMDSFELLANKEGDNEYRVINCVTSLNDISAQVREAFYLKTSNSFNYSVEGVYPEFVVVYSYPESTLYRFNYTINDGEIEFDEAVKVEKEFVEASKVDDKELIAALKEKGIEIENIDDIKAAIAGSSSVEELTTKLKAKEDEDKAKTNQLSAINAALNPDNQDDNPDGEKMATQLTEMAATYVKQGERLSQVEAQLLDTEAEGKVGIFIEAGKIVPAEKDHYLKLYKVDKELFESITANKPVVVKTGQAGLNGGTADNAGDDLDPDAELKRIVGAHVNGSKKES